MSQSEFECRLYIALAYTFFYTGEKPLNLLGYMQAIGLFNL